MEIFVGEKCSDKFRLEFDFHVILGFFYMPQICDMGRKNPKLKLGVDPKSRCIMSQALCGVTEGTGREIDHLVMKCATFRFAA
jgi:hypothetical protein